MVSGAYAPEIRGTRRAVPQYGTPNSQQRTLCPKRGDSDQHSLYFKRGPIRSQLPTTRGDLRPGHSESACAEANSRRKVAARSSATTNLQEHSRDWVQYEVKDSTYTVSIAGWWITGVGRKLEKDSTGACKARPPPDNAGISTEGADPAITVHTYSEGLQAGNEN